ncbi:pyridoxamine 5'-phosphate oxidase family protein [Pseudomonas coronafaciens]|uniref:pyridoxamine 5'-phosphate oxidase family protein n=1 Tax=Pseudomonas coronafaciens TaxID=53409 RepID=UPI000F00B55C|nr:pyridoxamine 5'-phosphate oxidase family protein [Pseudomonas coronafaciens]RMV65585.1 Pyridoxamine 5'-phosphate oxidase protein [Pseudomonas coronafaciens pv. atropurpurea]
MKNTHSSDYVTTTEALEALYGPIAAPSLVKEVDHIHPVYRPFIESAPFVVLASSGPGGLDASPRGDQAGFVHIEDSKTLYLPDRRGNNRIDTLRNIVDNPRVALLFLIPGVGETLRVNGTAQISIQPDLLARFEMKGQLPRSVLRITVTSVYFQCSRAVIRAGLWDVARQVERSSLPTAGQILKEVSASQIDGEAYDKALPGRIADTLY